MVVDPDMLLTASDTAMLLTISTATLHQWRKANTGPRWIKIASGAKKATVRYRHADVVEFIHHARELTHELDKAIPRRQREKWPGYPKEAIPLLARLIHILLTEGPTMACDLPGLLRSHGWIGGHPTAYGRMCHHLTRNPACFTHWPPEQRARSYSIWNLTPELRTRLTESDIAPNLENVAAYLKPFTTLPGRPRGHRDSPLITRPVERHMRTLDPTPDEIAAHERHRLARLPERPTEHGAQLKRIHPPA